MTTSFELVRNAIGFDCPEQIPLSSSWNRLYPGKKMANIALIGYKEPLDFVPTKPGMDEWGCVWKSMNLEEGDQGQVTEHPLEDWDNSKNYKFPDPFAPGRFNDIPARLEILRKEKLYILGSIGVGPMHRLDYLRGFENYLIDIIVNPERIKFMLDGIFHFLSGMVRQYGELGGIDGIMLWDDQAMQTGPMFSMDIWRQFFKPRYRQLFDLAHKYGMHVHMHACGHLGQHLVDLVEAGVDVIDNKQPSLWMDSPSVEEVKGKVAFSTCIDIQTTIHQIPVLQIKDEVDRLIRRLSTEDGGFIAACYWQKDLHIPEEVNRNMLNAFKTFHW